VLICLECGISLKLVLSGLHVRKCVSKLFRSRFMPRSYIFECPRCFYKTVVVGGLEEGLHCHFQTVVCHTCRRLYDIPIKLRVPITQAYSVSASGLNQFYKVATSDPANIINRLVKTTESKWIDGKLVCPRFPSHVVEKWNHPGACPICGTIMERSLRPYRVWD